MFCFQLVATGGKKTNWNNKKTLNAALKGHSSNLGLHFLKVSRSKSDRFERKRVVKN